mmetsp:Transcript_76956/g.223439  ORF Transcript_76956/g.223439 Transcript_76956/m.223439 type:complete len:296 (+) Transcript_76956:201-1088(+)
MAKKKPTTCKDLTVFWCNIISCALLIGCVVPQVPWLYEDSDPGLSLRFSSYRYYSPIAANDSWGSMVPWMTWAKHVCTALERLNQPNLLTLGSVAAQATGRSGIVQGGQLLGGCASWPICKKHVSERCRVYWGFAIIGFMAVALLVASVLAAIVVVVLMAQEGSAKKKKKKEEAAVYGMYTQLCAAAASLAGVALFIVGLNLGVSNLQRTAYYPRPSIYWGSYVAIAGTVMQLFAVPCACRRRYVYVKRETEDDADDGFGAAEYYGPPIGQPPMALGAGGYGGGYGGYPPGYPPY